jgi:hypothetical protein
MTDRRKEILDRLSTIKDEWRALSAVENEAHEKSEYAKVTQCFADKTVLFGEELGLCGELMKGA